MLIDHVIGGKYRITELIGQGGMGTVFEAVHTGTGARVAIKLIVSNDIKEEIFIRFQREARAAGTIDSQHIVRIFDMGTDERSKSPFMVMERLYGEDVSQLMRRVGPLQPEVAVSIAAQSAMGLAKAHEAGVIHRDVKPANLFLHDGDTGEVVVKILDFGIAKVLMDVMQRSEEGGLTRTGSMLGSPHYMSPEQAQGLRSIDRRSDVWSLGVVLYKMLTGQTPHAHVQTLGQVILAICSSPARPIQELAPWVPPEIAQIVHRCLQPDPNHRYQTAYDLYSALQPLYTSARQFRRSHIAPLSDTQRMRVAQPLVFPRSDSPTNGTQHGLVQATMQPPKKSSGIVVAFASLGVLAVVGVAGIGAALMAKKPAHAAQDPNPTPVSVTAVPVTAPPPASEPPPVAAPVERAVSVAISPANAQVEVDGQKREVVNGAIEIKGPLGSVARVRVVANGTDTTQPVAITETGPMPPKISAAPAASAPRTTPSRTPGTTAVGSKPGPAGTGVNVQRTFE